MAFLSTNIRNLQAVNIPQWILYAAYSIVYLSILPFFQHQTDVDTLGYLATAERYASGDFFGAINGFWSVMLSWLMVPLIVCKVPAILALKLVNLAGGLVGIRFIHLLSEELGIKPVYALFGQLAAMTHMAHFSLCVSTADVLSAVSWVAVVYYALRFYNHADFSSVVKLALAGTISYLTKYYHFYAFLLLLGILLLVIILQGKSSIPALIKTGIFFLLLSSAWMFAIYLKHGIFNPTTAAALNFHTSQHPTAPNHPQIGERILPLQYDKYLYTAWEYVPDYINPQITRKEDAVKLSLMERLQQVVAKNILKGSRYFYLETILFLLSLFVLFRSGSFRSNPKLLFFTCIILVYPLGYYATFVEYRYLIFCNLATVVLASLALQQASSVFSKIMLAALLTGSFLLPIHRMHQYGHKGNAYYTMNAYLNASDRLTHKHIVSSPGTWPRAMVLCYQSKARYYDTLFPDKIKHSNPELHQHDIAYYFCLATEVTPEMKTFGAITYYDIYALVELKHSNATTN